MKDRLLVDQAQPQRHGGSGSEEQTGVLTCAVIASDSGIRAVIEASLNPQGLEPKGVSSLGELLSIVRDVPVAGILLELVTSIRSSPEEKEAAHELTRFYPFARCKLVGQEIRVIGEGNSLEAFAERCRQFDSRTLRRETRERKNLAVYLSPDHALDDAEKCVTIDVSKGGCFVYSSREWKVGDRVWLRFFRDEVVIPGTVCFWRAWGGNTGIPGIGVRFDVESPSTKAESHH